MITPEAHYEFLLRFFRLTGFADGGYELMDGWFWRTDDEYAPLSLMVNCNDLFWWGCADIERLTPENIHILEEACRDATAANGGTCIYGQELFCARARKMRPQGACYAGMPRAIADLFDACGPERATGLGNPYPNDIHRKG